MAYQPRYVDPNAWHREIDRDQAEGGGPGARLITSLLNIQAAREERARRQLLDKLFAERQQREAEQQEFDNALKIRDVQRVFAGRVMPGERPTVDVETDRELAGPPEAGEAGVFAVSQQPAETEYTTLPALTVGGRELLGEERIPRLYESDLRAKAEADALARGELLNLTPEQRDVIAAQYPALAAFMPEGKPVRASMVAGLLPGLTREHKAAKSEWGSPFTGPDDISYQRNEVTGDIRRTPGVGRKPAEAKGGIPESTVKDIDRLPSSWRDWNASHVTRDSFTTRNSEQANAIAAANARGKVLPGKKQGDAAIAANATLADISQAQKLIADPEVRQYVGAYQGKMTNFLAKGWADPFGGEAKVPAKVRRFRAALNRLAAEERHRIYGAALTATESKYADGFLPAVDQSGATIDAALGEYADDIARGMDAMWGGSPAESPSPTASSDPEEGRTAINRATGQRLIKRGGKWVPLQ